VAHFAELNDNNVVTRVIVVDNKDTTDENGNEVEAIGAAFCQNLLGGRWVQTSYNSNFRVRYAGIGYTYDASLDAFICPQPYPSWTLNSQTCDWDPPTPKPDDGKSYRWDEATLSWVEVIPPPPPPTI
jgi:hypothetical protein